MATSSLIGSSAIGWSIRRVIVAPVVVMIIASLAIMPLYSGSGTAFLLFCFAFTASVAVCAIGRLSWFQFFLTAFLTLGFWAKLLVHLVNPHTFIEPVGTFHSTPESWDHALLVSAAGMSGVALMGILVKAFDRRSFIPDVRVALSPLFRRAAWPLFWLSTIVAVALFVANYHFAILRIGVNPRVDLPSNLYVIIAFTVSWGAIVWLSALTFWLCLAKQLSVEATICIVAVEGSLAAASMGSRVQMILHVAPVVLALLIWAAKLDLRFSRRGVGLAIAFSLVLFVGSLALVSVDRIITFSSPVEFQGRDHAVGSGNASSLTASTPTAATTDGSRGLPSPTRPAPAMTSAAGQETFRPAAYALSRDALRSMVRQVGRLFVDRWVGLEGVLAVSSHPDLRSGLLEMAARERPEIGVDALYQKIARATYGRSDDFTFMTIPGPIAVLFYSGSMIIVTLGMAALFLAGYVTERFADVWLRTPPASAVVGSALAYLVVQLNFPRTLLFFAIEIALALALLGLGRAALRLRTGLSD
jgi:hypothetical protein